jgi:hypothetical protein
MQDMFVLREALLARVGVALGKVLLAEVCAFWKQD